jgi:hypothetical protein
MGGLFRLKPGLRTPEPAALAVKGYLRLLPTIPPISSGREFPPIREFLPKTLRPDCDQETIMLTMPDFSEPTQSAGDAPDPSANGELSETVRLSMLARMRELEGRAREIAARISKLTPMPKSESSETPSQNGTQNGKSPAGNEP